MDRDYYILGLFIVMLKEIHQRTMNGQRLNPSEKMVAMMFMAKVIDSIKRICARESIDSRSILHHALRDLLHVAHTGDTSCLLRSGDETPALPGTEF